MNHACFLLRLARIRERRVCQILLLRRTAQKLKAHAVIEDQVGIRQVAFHQLLDAVQALDQAAAVQVELAGRFGQVHLVAKVVFERLCQRRAVLAVVVEQVSELPGEKGFKREVGAAGGQYIIQYAIVEAAVLPAVFFLYAAKTAAHSPPGSGIRRWRSGRGRDC